MKDFVHESLRFALLGLVWTAYAKADLVSITLDNSALSGSPNSAVTFTGVINNSSGSEVFLNGASADLAYSELTFDPTPFFTYAPLSLDDGDSYDGQLFTVAISAVAAAGDYFGTFVVQGGSDGSTFDSIGSADFEITVESSVPEPSSGGLLIIAVGMIIAVKIIVDRWGRYGR